jgi:hypothetical protein
VSGQCDVLILDPSTPPFWDEQDYRIVPVECLYGAIEVKSSLDSGELESAWKNIARLKALPKTAYHQVPGALRRTRWAHGRRWDYVPTVGIVLAYDGADIDTLAAKFDGLASDESPEHSIDSVWVLNKGYITWTNPVNGKIDMSREPGADFLAARATPDQILKPLTSHLYNHFATAWMPPLKIEDYLAGAWGTIAGVGTVGERNAYAD